MLKMAPWDDPKQPRHDRGNALPPRATWAQRRPATDPLVLTFVSWSDPAQLQTWPASVALTEYAYEALPAFVLDTPGDVSLQSIVDDLLPSCRARLVLAVWLEICTAGPGSAAWSVAQGIALSRPRGHRPEGALVMGAEDFDMSFLDPSTAAQIIGQVVRHKLA